MFSNSKKFLGGFAPPGKRPNLVQTIVSQTTSYLVNFDFLCWAVQKFYFEGPFWGVRPSEDP